MRKPRAKAPSTNSRAANIRAQMEQLQNELKRAEVEEETAFGKLARKIGIFDLEIPEADLKEALNGIVERFRSAATKTAATPEARKENSEAASEGAEKAAPSGG